MSDSVTEESLVLPPSFAQQRLWFLDQLEPNRPVYNIYKALHISGPVQREALEYALNRIIQRHEALRTTFTSVDGRPMQVISPSLHLSLHLVDIAPEELEQIALSEACKSFDLAQGPLIRAVLLRLNENTHVLLLTVHHIVADAWSLDILFRELEVFYRQATTDDDTALASLPELSIQYADYALWEQEWLQGEVLEEQLAYWRKHLAGTPALLNLPTDYPRPRIQTYNGAHRYFSLPAALVEKLNTLGQQQEVTLFMILLAAFQIVLMRYARQEEVVVGIPFANRTQAEVEGLIGFFANTLALHVDLAGDPSFQQLLQQVREATLEGYAHQDLPFEKLIEDLRPERNMSYNPLVQVAFSFYDTAQPNPKLPELAAHFLNGLTNESSRFDMLLLVAPATEVPMPGMEAGSFTLTWEYNTDLFTAETIGRMASYYLALLENIVTRSSRHISEISMLTQAEQDQILFTWNATQADYAPTCLHQLFEDQVERTPEAVALVYEKQHLTYTELNERANRLAHHIQSLGVGPEVLVGICTTRSIEMVVGLLAILKAGGAYVPLDPAYPKERLAFMLEDAQAKILLTQKSLLSVLPSTQAQLIFLDRDLTNELQQYDATNLQSIVQPLNLAYVIYTSGSTGKPKGVALTHRSVTIFIHWAREVFTPQDLAGVLASTSICFDLSVFELFVPLSWGGRVVLVENALQLPTVSDEMVTLVNTIPSAMTALLGMGDIPSSIRIVNLAGEALPVPLVQALYRLQNIQRVYNLYGPSEDTTYSTFAEMPKGTVDRIAIGRPVANTQVYLLDAYLQPVPVGVTGEIYLGGMGLARGYFRRPELTAERFIPDPFGKEAGGRLYRTGDLARYWPDGSIEYLGRIDAQVKIRGFRIELEEIKVVLAQHPSVRDCAVIVREDAPGEKQLVAYIVTQENGAGTMLAPDQEQLRKFLREKLPEYMVPAAFVLLEALPLTPNGKLDRRALPTPQRQREEVYEVPRTPVEEIIAEVWAQVQHLERVGIHDNFFALGGHSLLATQVISRLRRIFQLDLPLISLFEAPTIASLSETLIKYEKVPGRVASIAKLRKQIDSMSAEEIRARLQKTKKE